MRRAWLKIYALLGAVYEVQAFIQHGVPHRQQPAPRTSRCDRKADTRVPLFNLKQFFGGGGAKPPLGKKDDKEGLGEAIPFAPGQWGKGVPSMDDLWREAWPVPACQDMMKRREMMNTGTGPPHFENLVRTFGGNETSYNIFYRDAAGWCPYCQSVWMLLEEKQLPYKVKKVNLLAYGEKPDWFFKVSPSGLLPVLELEGRLVRESTEIMRLVDWWRGCLNDERMFPTQGSDKLQEAESLLQLERDLFREWFIWVFESPEEKGREEFLDVFDKVETALGVYPGPWFLVGEGPGLIDCAFAPKVERMVASVLYFKGMALRRNDKYPHLNRWLDALDRRASYSAFKGDFYNINQALPAQFGRAYPAPDTEPLRSCIDGKAPGSWALPVTYGDEDLEYVLPDLRPTQPVYTRQAVAIKLIVGHKRVPRYMLRALGRPGDVAFRSALSDPNNTDAPAAFLASVEGAYRWLILALLRGHDKVEESLRSELKSAEEEMGKKGKGEGRKGRGRLIKCLSYLRDRVGVPRDMSLPEARELRGHLNWMIGVLEAGE